MSTLVSPADALIAQQMERQLTIYLRESIPKQQMADTDRWLYSVWEGQPDWVLLEHLLSGNGQQQIATAIPVLIGCLQCYRQPDLKDYQAALLAKQQQLVYQQTLDTFSQGKSGLLNGGSVSFHYAVLTNGYFENAHQWKRLLLNQCVTEDNAFNEAVTDLSLGTGQTGWILTLIQLVETRQYVERIFSSVSELKLIITRYVDYLLVHQLSIDAEIENYSFFPTSIGQSEWEITNTLSWAAGDIGQVLLLYKAGQLLQRPDIIQWADRLSGYLVQRRALNRVSNDQLGLMDGLAGLSLMYRQLFLLTNRREFLTEGYYWLDQLLRRVQTGNYGSDQSLLTGTLGINGTLRQWLGNEVGLDLLFL